MLIIDECEDNATIGGATLLNGNRRRPSMVPCFALCQPKAIYTWSINSLTSF